MPMIDAGVGILGTLGTIASQNKQYNLALQQRNLQRLLSERAYRLGTAGRDTPESSTYFDGTKWVTTLTPHGEMSRGMDDRARSIGIQSAGQVQREQARGEGPRIQALQDADANRRQISAGGGTSKSALEAMLAEKYLAASQDPLDRASKGLNMLNVRGAANGVPDALATINGMSRAGVRGALANARVDATMQHPGLRDAEGGQVRSDYERNTKIGMGVPNALNYNPSGATELATAAGQGAANNSAYGSGVAASALRGANDGVVVPTYGKNMTSLGTGLTSLAGLIAGRKGSGEYKYGDDEADPYGLRKSSSGF